VVISLYAFAYMLIYTKFNNDFPNGCLSTYAKTLSVCFAADANTINPNKKKRVVLIF